MNLRSLAASVFAAALLGAGTAARAAEVIVGPGTTGEITLNISNAADSVSAISGAAVSVKVVPPEFAASFVVDQANSVLGPVNLAVGGNQTFRVKYTIGQNPPEGSFEVILLATSAVEGVLPERGTFDADSNIQDTSVLQTAILIPSVVENAVRAIFQTRVVGPANIGPRELPFRCRARLASSARARAQLSGEIPNLAVLGRDPGARQRPSTAAVAENGPRHGLKRSSPRARTGGLTRATLPPGFARSADEAGLAVAGRNNGLLHGLRISVPRALARPRLDRAYELGRLRTLGRQASLDPAPVARAQLSRELLKPARLRTLGRRASSVAFAAAGGAAAAPGVVAGIRWRGRPARAQRFTQALHFRAFRAAQLRARAGTGGAPPAQLLVRARTAELFARARLCERYSAGPAMEFFRTPRRYGRRAFGAAGGNLFYLVGARRAGNDGDRAIRRGSAPAARRWKGANGRQLSLRLSADGGGARRIRFSLILDGGLARHV